MALKGAIAKEEVAKKILEIFKDSFKYDKEIRVPMVENGEEVQIKITLTAAKVCVDPSGNEMIPGEVNEAINFEEKSNSQSVEISQEEKDNVTKLARLLDL